MRSSCRCRKIHGYCLGILILQLSLGLCPVVAMAQSQLPGAKAGDVLWGATESRFLKRSTAKLIDVPKTKRRAQIAFVVDATDSMGNDLNSLKQKLTSVVTNLLNDKSRDVKSVSVAVVVYRDSEAPKGTVEIPLPDFSEDLNEVQRVLGEIPLQSGAPYFQERVDEGLHAALTQLKWAPSSDTETERWIICCGDAPPYPELSPFRKNTNDDLCQEANQRGIHFCFVLCSSGFIRQDLDQATLDGTAKEYRHELETFAADLAKRTEGTQVDTARMQSINFWIDHQIKLAEPITAAEIASARKDRQPGTELRVAILPHMPLNKMKFEATADEVLVARQLTESLRRVDGFDVKQAAVIEREFQQIRKQIPETPNDVGDSQLISKLAKNLNVDYVIWGNRQGAADTLQLELKLYRSSDGTVLARQSDEVQKGNVEGERDLAPLVLRRLCGSASKKLSAAASTTEDARVFGQLDQNDSVAKELLIPLAQNHRAHRSLLMGIELLERSLDLSKDAAVVILKQAADNLNVSLEFEEANPVTQMLLANCYFNLSRNEALDDWSVKHLGALRKAYEYRTSLGEGHPARYEIEAYYQLFVRKDYEAATSLFSRIASLEDKGAGRFRLRAHWMLAGIHMGDWGAVSFAPQLLNVAEARKHIVFMMADWPNSPASRFYGEYLNEPSIPVGQDQLAQRP